MQATCVHNSFESATEDFAYKGRHKVCLDTDPDWSEVNLYQTLDGINLVRLKEVAPDVKQSQRYATAENFTGAPVPGYNTNMHKDILCTYEVARALKELCVTLLEDDLCPLVYDIWRPQRAVDAFVRWSKEPEKACEAQTKSKYYPSLAKSQLLPLGYIAQESKHCTGNTVDLTLIDLKGTVQPVTVQHTNITNTSGSKERIPRLSDGSLNMGTGFDFFHEISHSPIDASVHSILPEYALENRKSLLAYMEGCNFTPYFCEWWHFSYCGPRAQWLNDNRPTLLPPTLEPSAIPKTYQQSTQPCDLIMRHRHNMHRRPRSHPLLRAPASPLSESIQHLRHMLRQQVRQREECARHNAQIQEVFSRHFQKLLENLQ